ncbi:MAG: CRISPR-associated protein Cas4 [Caldisericum exile]|uniref:CRISPR-associated protein Cas4 n=1 Tax=Caldisericum exile TaxID=693075 RepID=UPI003C75BFD3
MKYVVPEDKLFRVRVSGLAQYVYCGKKSKIVLFNKPEIADAKSRKAVSIGIKLHKMYETMMRNLSFDRALVRFKLKWNYRNFEKQVKDTNILVTGHPDDIRVLRITENGKAVKYAALIEVKTTSRKLWKREVLVGIKQLQLYMWLLKEELDKIGFPLWKYGILEYYSQRTGDLIKRVSVEYDDNIEEWIKYVVDSFKGKKPLNIPRDISTCKHCYGNIKEKCEYWSMMKDAF